MADVVSFPRSDAAGIRWRCGCGNWTFELRGDGQTECADCGKLVTEPGQWVRPHAEPPADNAEPAARRQLIDIGSSKAALRRVLESALDDRDQTIVAIVVKDSNLVRAYRSERFNAPGRKGWLSRRLADAWEVLTGEKR